MPQLGYITDPDGNEVLRTPRLDAATHAQVGMTVAHNQIHDGKSYMARVWLTSIGLGNYLALGFTTPEVAVGNVVVDWTAETEAQIDVLEAPVNTPGANPVIVGYNRNRNSPNLSGFTNLRLYNNVGVVGGTSIDFDYSWAPRNAGGGESRGTMEIQLRSSTVYAIRFTAIAIGGGLLKLSWYEHEAIN